MRLDDPQLRGMDAGENALNACRIKPIHMLEQTRKHRPIVSQHRIVAVLEQVRLFDLDLFAKILPPLIPPPITQ